MQTSWMLYACSVVLPSKEQTGKVYAKDAGCCKRYLSHVYIRDKSIMTEVKGAISSSSMLAGLCLCLFAPLEGDAAPVPGIRCHQDQLRC